MPIGDAGPRQLRELHHLLNTGRGGELNEATLLIFGPLR